MANQMVITFAINWSRQDCLGSEAREKRSGGSLFFLARKKSNQVNKLLLCESFF